MRYPSFPGLALCSLLMLGACSSEGSRDKPDVDEEAGSEKVAVDYGYETHSADNLADTMASNDSAATSSSEANGDAPDAEQRPIMQAQVVLERIGFAPGVIDGKMGMSTEIALRGFQEARELPNTGRLDDATAAALAKWRRIPATRVVTIPQAWGKVDYQTLPTDVSAQAKLARLAYQSLDERLAERFHTTAEVLHVLNPAAASGKSASGEQASEGNSAASFRAGQRIRVPNIGADRIVPGTIEDRDWQRTLASLGVGTVQPQVDRIVVSKAGKTLKAFRGEELVAQFTVTSGSSEFPLPLGEWKILGEARNPPYSYDPEVLGKGDGRSYKLPPGPNSPVGVIWIDLSKEHYGIHGTDDPASIGRAQSSGCVRLTNWDAARLSQMVSQETRVLFEA